MLGAQVPLSGRSLTKPLILLGFVDIQRCLSQRTPVRFTGMGESNIDNLIDLRSAIAEHEARYAELALAAVRLADAGEWALDGSLTMTAWLRHHLRMTDTDASMLLRHGRFLDRFEPFAHAADLWPAVAWPSECDAQSGPQRDRNDPRRTSRRIGRHPRTTRDPRHHHRHPRLESPRRSPRRTAPTDRCPRGALLRRRRTRPSHRAVHPVPRRHPRLRTRHRNRHHLRRRQRHPHPRPTTRRRPRRHLRLLQRQPRPHRHPPPPPPRGVGSRTRRHHAHPGWPDPRRSVRPDPALRLRPPPSPQSPGR